MYARSQAAISSLSWRAVYGGGGGGGRGGGCPRQEAATEGGEALFGSLDLVDKVAQIGGFAVSAVMLPYHIKSLVTNAMEIDAARKGKNDKEPEAVKKLRQLADQLEKDMHDKKGLFRAVDDLFLMATTQDSNPLENTKC